MIHIHNWFGIKRGHWTLRECTKCRKRTVRDNYASGYSAFPQWWLDGLDAPPELKPPTP